MVSTTTQADITSADKTGIGFDYQYYFFLWKLLSLEIGQTVGLECKDDVHTDLADDVQILYQVKHTIKTSEKTKKPSNLTTFDIDLWKTLSNWSKVITDTNASRSTQNEQIKFIDKTYFVLASNKSESSDNEFAKIIKSLQEGKLTIEEARENLSSLKNKTKSDVIKRYFDDILMIPNQVLKCFFDKISFQLEENDIFDNCYKSIKSKMIPESKICQVFRDIDSAIRKDNFINIKKGEKIFISFDDFYRKYSRYFDNARNDSLQVYTFNEQLPKNLQDQLFLKQLLEIEDFCQDDIETMAEYTSHMLKIKRNLSNWKDNGDLTYVELDTIREDSIQRWKNIFRKKYRRAPKEEKANEIAIEVIDETRDIKVNFSDLPENIILSNGYYYYLSDIPTLGWRYDWDKYKNEK